MDNTQHLYILWTNDNKITAEKMVFMYGINSKIREWWDEVTIIVWGAPALLISKDKDIQNKITDAMGKGVHLTACKACADQLGVTEDLEKLGIEVIYWGEPLTQLLQNDAKILTI